MDESELTGNDSKASFQLIQPLLKDLELLEFKGLAFKFFLWDQLEPYYLEIARTDRIRHETLEWDDDMLLTIWEKRLQAFSKSNISKLSSICDNTKLNPDDLALILANQSPRDMIRVAAQILAEQQQIDISSNRISDSLPFRCC